jgi:hypothetical protein
MDWQKREAERPEFLKPSSFHIAFLKGNPQTNSSSNLDEPATV